MSRIEVTKVGSMAVTGKEGAIHVSKMGVFLVLQPGVSGDDGTSRQAHVSVQIRPRP